MITSFSELYYGKTYNTKIKWNIIRIFFDDSEAFHQFSMLSVSLYHGLNHRDYERVDEIKNLFYNTVK